MWLESNCETGGENQEDGNSDFFSFANCDRTRGHNLKMYIQNSRLDVRKFSFARRVCPVWNSLPHEIVNTTSLRSFKRKLDTVNFV